MDPEYEFSVVMPVYNCEEYIKEAIESVICQTIGFLNRVQLILVNDGSTDKSGDICEEYKSRFPNNIIVIHKENGGVSSARNTGLKYIRGKYTSFVDADDMIEVNALEKAAGFFESNPKVDVSCIALYQYNETSLGKRVSGKTPGRDLTINLIRHPNFLQKSVCSAFFRSKAIANICFDEEFKTHEDLDFIVRVLLNKLRIGVISDSKYYFRQRLDASTALGNTEHYEEDYFAQVLNRYTNKIVSLVKSEFGYIPSFVQYSIMDLIVQCINAALLDSFNCSDDCNLKLKSAVANALKYVDVKCITENNGIRSQHKNYLVSLKNAHESSVLTLDNNDAFLYNENTPIIAFSDTVTTIDFIKYNEGNIIVEGHTFCMNCSKDEPIVVYAKINDKIQPLQLIERKKDQYLFGDLILRDVGFILELEDDKNIPSFDITFFYNYRGSIIRRSKLVFGKFSPIGKELKYSYYYKDGRVFTLTEDNAIRVEQCGFSKHVRHEAAVQKELIRSKKPRTTKVAIYRLLYFICKIFLRKKIWICADFINRSDDNGKAFFKYLNEKKYKGIKPYFVITKDSPDYPAVKKLGTVLPFFSKRHFMAYLLADKLISSHADSIFVYPLRNLSPYCRDLTCHQQFVFLQHGIIQNDNSKPLNRYMRNISCFVTSVQPEYDSILEYDYYYTKKDVVLTGLPRYDDLYDASEKLITIMPTWRRDLMAGFLVNEGKWVVKDTFPQSQYYKMFNSLLNDERLLDVAEKHGYTIAYLPHPTSKDTLKYMTKDPRVMFIDHEMSYKEIYAKSSMVIGDYTSAVFDFAYLKKPVLYFQFDQEYFFTTQYTQGYFDFYTLGFGEVETTLDGIVNRMIEYIENDCKLKPMYLERIDSFFAFNDKHNCDRLYNHLIQM